MGNPCPTRSKPCKIGRKHTGALSSKQLQQVMNTARRKEAVYLQRWRVWNDHVKAYGRGERDTHPGPEPTR